ncbi:MAG TPA: DJ-1/PfpI family protein [bacterium]|nr:DJ-1/PfpI family protein [bacterium]
MRSWMVMFIIALCAATLGGAEKGGIAKKEGTMEKRLNEKKILMIIAPEKFRDEEFAVPHAHFAALGAQVTVASTRKGTATGMFGAKAEATATLAEVKATDYDAVVFVGGAGVPTVRAEPRAVEIAKEAKGLPVLAAICWAPTILAKAGVLAGKKATVWKGDDAEYGMTTDKMLEKNGAKFTGEEVTVDGNIVTGNGPAAAQKFAEAIEKRLSGGK